MEPSSWSFQVAIFRGVGFLALGSALIFLAAISYQHVMLQPTATCQISGDWSSWSSCHLSKLIWMFPKIGIPQNGGFIMENPIFFFWWSPIFGNILLDSCHFDVYGSWNNNKNLFRGFVRWGGDFSVSSSLFLDFRLISLCTSREIFLQSHQLGRFAMRYCSNISLWAVFGNDAEYVCPMIVPPLHFCHPYNL